MRCSVCASVPMRLRYAMIIGTSPVLALAAQDLAAAHLRHQAGAVGAVALPPCAVALLRPPSEGQRAGRRRRRRGDTAVGRHRRVRGAGRRVRGAAVRRVRRRRRAVGGGARLARGGPGLRGGVGLGLGWVGAGVGIWGWGARVGVGVGVGVWMRVGIGAGVGAGTGVGACVGVLG